jgi:UDP:flavonoid glycosyltransferase YjiC (YdhE family)
VGAARRFSATTKETLVEDLGEILIPECATRARALSTQMTSAADSVTRAADLLERFAHTGSFA